MYRAEKAGPGLVSLLQMCLVNLVNQILESCVENGAVDDAVVTNDGDAPTNVSNDVDVKSVLSSLLPLPDCDAKSLCLAKIQILIETS